MKETANRLLSLREVKAILGLGWTTLSRLATTGELRPRKIRGRLGYLESEVQLFIYHYLWMEGKRLRQGKESGG